MKSKTIAAAITLGFDFSQLDDNAELSEIAEKIITFLNDHLNDLDQEYDEVEVNGIGSRQFVNHGDFSSSGVIIDWSYYWTQPRQKIEHSYYLYICDDGTPVNMTLWCWSKNEDAE